MKRNRDILNYRILKVRNTVASIQLNLIWVKINLMLFHLKSVPIDCLKCHRAETTEQRTNPNRGDSKRRFKQFILPVFRSFVAGQRFSSCLCFPDISAVQKLAPNALSAPAKTTNEI